MLFLFVVGVHVLNGTMFSCVLILSIYMHMYMCIMYYNELPIVHSIKIRGAPSDNVIYFIYVK